MNRELAQAYLWLQAEAGLRRAAILPGTALQRYANRMHRSGEEGRAGTGHHERTR